MTAQGPAANRPVHGGVKPEELRALGLNPEDVLDFSASVSPIGPPEGVWEALRKVDLGAYPDPHCLVLREELSARLSRGREVPLTVPIDNILVGNGSTEIIHLLARVFLSGESPAANRSALQLAPTYGEYAGACGLMGVAISAFQAPSSPPFRWDMDEAASRIRRDRPRLVFVCNPNNPTGVYLDEADVGRLARATAACEGLLIIDEAYISFVDTPWDSLGMALDSNVVLLRSMTKDYALTSLRLGYAVASTAIIDQLAALQPDWSVNGFAQAAGLAALADAGYLSRAKDAVDEAKDFLADRLDRLGLTMLPSSANFVLVNVSDAKLWRDKLMRLGIFVRDCASFGLPSYIRIGIRDLPDCQRLVAAMETVSFQV